MFRLSSCVGFLVNGEFMCIVTISVHFLTNLQRSGIIFPRRTDTANTNLTPPQIHPIAQNNTSPQRSPINTTPGSDISRSSDLPVLR